MSDSTAVVEVTEAKEPKVVPALKKAGSVTGHGVHVAGQKVADANLRSLGRGVKTLFRKIPVRVEVRHSDKES